MFVDCCHSIDTVNTAIPASPSFISFFEYNTIPYSGYVGFTIFVLLIGLAVVRFVYTIVSGYIQYFKQGKFSPMKESSILSAADPHVLLNFIVSVARNMFLFKHGNHPVSAVYNFFLEILIAFFLGQFWPLLAILILIFLFYLPAILYRRKVERKAKFISGLEGRSARPSLGTDNTAKAAKFTALK